MFLAKAQKDDVATKSLVKRITKTLIFSLSLCPIKMHMHVCKALWKRLSVYFGGDLINLNIVPRKETGSHTYTSRAGWIEGL
jgi:hypothetical protein